MNWQALTFDWNHVRAFLATAEEGSLSAAARALGQTQPTIGRQVAALEENLKVTLFERIGKSLVLTDAGRDVLDHVRQMGDAALRLSLRASGQSLEAEGLVRITASDVFSAVHLPGALCKIRNLAPGIRVEVLASNDITDLQRREADIAIRHQRPEQPELFARLLQTTEAFLYGAPAYLERLGMPKTLSDLERFDFVSFGDPESLIAHLRPRGLNLRPEQFRYGSGSGLVAWELVRAGLGIGILTPGGAAMSPDIRKLPVQPAPIEFPVWLTTHRELHTSRRIRLVFDVLAAHFKERHL